jgi:hypothetical protein
MQTLEQQSARDSISREYASELRSPTNLDGNRFSKRRTEQYRCSDFERFYLLLLATLIAVLAIAFLVFIFGLIAQEVAGGETSAFDRRLILLLRDPANPSVPIGPAWLQEAARDVTSLGSIVVGYRYACRCWLPFSRAPARLGVAAAGRRVRRDRPR